MQPPVFKCILKDFPVSLIDVFGFVVYLSGFIRDRYLVGDSS